MCVQNTHNSIQCLDEQNFVEWTPVGRHTSKLGPQRSLVQLCTDSITSGEKASVCSLDEPLGSLPQSRLSGWFAGRVGRHRPLRNGLNFLYWHLKTVSLILLSSFSTSSMKWLLFNAFFSWYGWIALWYFVYLVYLLILCHTSHSQNYNEHCSSLCLLCSLTIKAWSWFRYSFTIIVWTFIFR